MAIPVSVIIPCYNRAGYLPLTVRSLLAQTHPPAEVIIVDDGSSEDTAASVKDIDPRVQFHRQKNSGVCRARNFGVELSSSPWLAFCDNDDLWREDKLEKQMALHSLEPALEYSFTNFATVVNDQWSAETKFDGLPDGFFGPTLHRSASGLICSNPLYDSILRSQPIFPSSILMSRSFFHRIGAFREDLGRNPAEDMEFTLRCVQHAPIGVVTDPVVGIRKHASNISGDVARLTARQVEIFRLILASHDLSPASRAIIHEEIVHRSLASSHRAFSEQRFDLVRELLSNVPPSAMTANARVKQLVSSLPAALAAPVARLLARSPQS